MTPFRWAAVFLVVSPIIVAAVKRLPWNDWLLGLCTALLIGLTLLSPYGAWPTVSAVLVTGSGLLVARGLGRGKMRSRDIVAASLVMPAQFFVSYLDSVWRFALILPLLLLTVGAAERLPGRILSWLPIVSAIPVGFALLLEAGVVQRCCMNLLSLTQPQPRPATPEKYVTGSPLLDATMSVLVVAAAIALGIAWEALKARLHRRK